ncbi:MAG: TlpA family protein disulfide reductase [Candidatus Promineifilaceae bacterium]
MPKTRFGWSVSFIACLLFGLYWIDASQMRGTDVMLDASAEFAAIGYTAPDFQLTSLDAEIIQLAQKQGKPILLNFWATWCGPCRAEMPALQRISAEFSETALVIGVNQGEQTLPVIEFANEFGISYPILLDQDNTISRLYRVRSLPTTYFIDANGVIRNQLIGTASEAVLSSRLENLLINDE